MSIADTAERGPRSLSYEDLGRIFDTSRFGDPVSLREPSVYRLGDSDQILAAQQLQAYRYLREGYVSLADIDRSPNVIDDKVDPYKQRSHYFSLADASHPEKPLIVVRQILPDIVDTFPLLQHIPLYDASLESLGNDDLGSYIEMSGLAKLPGVPGYMTLLFYRNMWHHSLQAGHEKWLIASDERLTQSLKEMFGSAMRTLGDTHLYMGSPTDPLLFDVRNGLSQYISDLNTISDPTQRRKKIMTVRIMLEGLDLSLLNPNQQAFARQVLGFLPA